jgi:hypothetical protein
MLIFDLKKILVKSYLLYLAVTERNTGNIGGCGGSVGDVVAQLAKATGRHQTEDAAVPGSNPAPPQSPERGQDI